MPTVDWVLHTLHILDLPLYVLIRQIFGLFLRLECILTSKNIFVIFYEFLMNFYSIFGMNLFEYFVSVCDDSLLFVCVCMLLLFCNVCFMYTLVSLQSLSISLSPYLSPSLS